MAGMQRSNQLRNSDFFKIHIKHIPTGQRISFEGFVTQFSDAYTAQWNEEQVYGRMDPLATYQGTKRNITLGFDIPADSKQMATHNMQMIQKLIQFMYPVYDSGDLSTQNVLSAAPLLTLKWTNLISSVNNEGQELVGYINGPISYAPDVADGGFMHSAVTTYEKEGQVAKEVDIRNYFPKKISMSFNFTVLHTHLLGWAPSGEVDRGQSAEMQANTRSYVFASQEVNDRFPNIYKEYPIPNDVLAGPGASGTTDAEADAAVNNTVAALEESLGDEGTPSPTQQEIAQQNREAALAAGADRQAGANELLGRSTTGQGEGDLGLTTDEIEAKYASN
jgi:hypothetical protein